MTILRVEHPEPAVSHPGSVVAVVAAVTITLRVRDVELVLSRDEAEAIEEAIYQALNLGGD